MLNKYLFIKFMRMQGCSGAEWRSQTFFTFCFKLALKLFQNGYNFGYVPTPILLTYKKQLLHSISCEM